MLTKGSFLNFEKDCQNKLHLSIKSNTNIESLDLQKNRPYVDIVISIVENVVQSGVRAIASPDIAMLTLCTHRAEILGAQVTSIPNSNLPAVLQMPEGK